MTKKLIMNLTSLEKRIAITQNQQVVEFILQQPNHEEITGNIYYGKVTDVLPGMQAAFVDIGTGKNGYLHRDQIQKYHLAKSEQNAPIPQSISNYVYQGEKILVQVQKDSFGTKGPKLSGLIEIPSANLVYLPFGNYIAVSKKIKVERDKWRDIGKRWVKNDEGIVFRTSCEGHNEEIIYEELIHLRERFKQIEATLATSKSPNLLYEENFIVDRLLREIPSTDIEEIVIDDFEIFHSLKQQYIMQKQQPVLTHYTKKENIFNHFKLEQEFEKALKPIVWLNNGAYMIIEHTEAMTVIDVNTGKFAGKSDYKETIFKTNQLAAKEVARQIRLRDIGGIIVVDFIDMSNDADKKQILNVLRASFEHDRSRTNILGFTGLGLIEISRKKVRPNLLMAETKTCQTCSGTGRVMSDEAICFKLERELWEYRLSDIDAIWIETTASVKKCLGGENDEHLTWLKAALKFEIIFTITDFITPTYAIRHVGTVEEVQTRIADYKK